MGRKLAQGVPNKKHIHTRKLDANFVFSPVPLQVFGHGMTVASSNMPSSIPARRITTNSQPKPSTSARTSTAQALVQPQTSKSTSTLPRRTTSTPKPTRPTTRVLATPHVGDRVILENGQKGILRYQGETSFKQGIWAGIELDTPGSGKNSGTVNG